MRQGRKEQERNGLHRLGCGMYLQHPVRQIHQLPLVLNNFSYCGCLILLEFTDVIGDYLQIHGRTLTIHFFRTQTKMKTEYLCTTLHSYFILSGMYSVVSFCDSNTNLSCRNMHLNQKHFNCSSHSCMNRCPTVGSRVGHLFTPSLTPQNQFQKAVSIIREILTSTLVWCCLVICS